LTAGNVGPVEMTGKLAFAVNDSTELNYYLNNTQPILSTVFTSGSNSLTIVMSKCAFIKASVIDSGSPYIKVTSPIRAIRNSTDSGCGKITLLNPKNTAY
jgi:hypothetical protein